MTRRGRRRLGAAIVVTVLLAGSAWYGRRHIDELRTLWVGENIESGPLDIDPVRVHYTVASTHPRILLNDNATLERLRERLRLRAPDAVKFQEMVDAAMAGEKVYGFQPWFAALLFRVTGDPLYARYAVASTDAAVAVEEARIASGRAARVADDSYLDVGPSIGNVALVFDWCHDALSADQRARWLAYADQAVWNVWHPRTAQWGDKTFRWTGWSVNNPSNNYYYSFLRATMLLGLAGHGESDQAQTWLDIFRVRKLERQLFPTFDTDLSGGGSREGTGYGVAMYSLFQLLDWWQRSTGERLADRSPHTLASMAFMMHATVPTLDRLAPTGDHARDASAALFDYHRAYLLELIALYPDERLSAATRSFLDASSVPAMGFGFDYVLDYLYAPAPWPADAGPAPARLPLATLATTYWAPGTGQLAMRSAWTRDATYANFICGPFTESHAHRDQTSFVIYKNGWLANDANMQTRSGIEPGEALHNLVRFERGGAAIKQNNDDAACSLTALADNPGFTYAAADATRAYARRKGISQAGREYLFIKPDTFVVLDRGLTASDVQRTWTLNLPQAPLVQGERLHVGQGASRLDVIRLSPAGLAWNVVPWNTQGTDVQEGFRADATAIDGAPFLHVLGVDGAVTRVERADDDGHVGARITFKDGRRAVVRFDVAASGGTLELRTTDDHALYDGPLPTTVQAPPLFATRPAP